VRGGAREASDGADDVGATSAPVSRLDLPGELEGLAVLALGVDVPGAHVLLVLGRRRRRRLLAEGVDAQRAARRPRGRLERRRAGREEEYEEAAGHCEGCKQAEAMPHALASQHFFLEVAITDYGTTFREIISSHGGSIASARETKR
jgi:hypothetical protein